MNEMGLNLLIVENPGEKSDSLKNYRHPGVSTIYAGSQRKAFQVLNDEEIHIVLCNHSLTDVKCADFLKKLSTEYPESLRILVSAENEIPASMKAINQGLIYSYIPKPFSHEEVRLAISHALDFINLKLRNDKLIADLARMTIRLKKRSQEMEIKLEENLNLIEELQKSQTEINRKENFSSGLIENMPIGITVSDNKGIHIRVNPAMCRMTGYSEEELIGRPPPHPYWPVELHKSILNSFKNLKMGETGDVETIFIRKNGEHFPVLVNPSILRNELGEMVSFVAIIKDITEIRKSEEILKANAELSKDYQRLINSIDGVLWEASLPDFKTIFISSQTEKILGYTVKQWLKDINFWKSHVHPDDREQADKYSTEMSLAGKSHTLEYRFIKKNGEIIWLRDIVNVEVLEGTPVLLRGVFVDITAQKLAQNKIEKLNEELEKKVKQRTRRLNAALLAKKESEKLYRSMFFNNHAVMLLVDPEDSGIVDANPAACNYYGYSHEVICQKKISDLSVLPPQEVVLKMKDIIQTEKDRFETKHRLSDGEIRDVEVYSGTIFIERQLLFSIIHDITARIKAQDEIKKNAKTQEVLLKEVNHRVKNNLAALIGILHIERDRIKKSGDVTYLSLLSDLTSRIQGLLTVHQLFSLKNWQPVEINELCERIIKSAFSGMTLSMKLDLHVEHSSILVSSRIAHHLTLVVNELATNSLKHALGKRNTVRIEVSATSSGKSVKLKYKDDGIGFPPEFIKGDFSRANIGFELIRGIIAQSLDGTLKLQNKDGAIAFITFDNQSD